MANIVPVRDGGYDRRESRMASRVLVRLENQTDVGIARIEHAASCRRDASERLATSARRP